MREWNLLAGDPLALTIAADARLAQTDYTNDHTWELTPAGGEPSALAVQTTYGLRARLMRIFPRFTQHSQPVSDPGLFAVPPQIKQFFPNYLRLSCAPFSGIDVICEYWVPSSQTLSGRIRITNSSVIPRQFLFELAALLSPLGDGSPMTPVTMQVTTTLQGQSGSLSPVLFMTGGPEAGSGAYPSLALEMDLAPGNFRQLTWAIATLTNPQDSFEEARRVTARGWDAELARIEMINEADTVDIHTGDPEWDAVLAFSQKTAWSLMLSPTSALPNASFVGARSPDTGNSIRGDGSDYTSLWNGQTALDAWHLTGSLLPGDPQIAEGLLANFLVTQDAQGVIDCKPGLGGQRGRFLAPPMLAALAWRIYQSTFNVDFLKDAFPRLLRFANTWFSALHDRDGDGFPEWAHPFQTGFEDNPAFDRLHPWGQGLDISLVENPVLGAFLVREVHALELIARVIGSASQVSGLTGKAETVRKLVEDTWDGRRGSYRYRDRDTHRSIPGDQIGSLTGSGELLLNKQFKIAQRLLFKFDTQTSTARTFSMVVHGETARGPHVEEITGRSLVWAQGKASLSSRYTYHKVISIEVQGLFEKDTLTVRTPDYTQDDISLLLPLWAHLPNSKRAETMVKKGILDEKRFRRSYGLPMLLPNMRGEEYPAADVVDVRWNSLMAEGMLAYGFRQEAAWLFTAMMPALARALRFQRAFYGQYSAESGDYSGDRHALAGIASLRLFLDILGIAIQSPQRVVVSGANPFPWAVEVRYRGLCVSRQEKQTVVTFPDGQSITVTGTGTHLVSLS